MNEGWRLASPGRLTGCIGAIGAAALLYNLQGHLPASLWGTLSGHPT